MSSTGINRGRTLLTLIFSTPVLNMFSCHNLVLFLFHFCNKILLDSCLHMLCSLILWCGFRTRSTFVFVLVLENPIDLVVFVPITITNIICMRCKEHNFKHYPNMCQFLKFSSEIPRSHDLSKWITGLEGQGWNKSHRFPNQWMLHPIDGVLVGVGSLWPLWSE
jgi:hypothetical protein